MKRGWDRQSVCLNHMPLIKAIDLFSFNVTGPRPGMNAETVNFKKVVLLQK